MKQLMQNKPSRSDMDTRCVEREEVCRSAKGLTLA